MERNERVVLITGATSGIGRAVALRFAESGARVVAAGRNAEALRDVGAAIKSAGTTDGAKVRDALAAIKDFPGVTGKITIDANRNASKPAVILTIKNGQFNYVQTVSP